MKNTTIKVSNLNAEKNPMTLTELSPEISTNVQGGGIFKAVLKTVGLVLTVEASCAS